MHRPPSFDPQKDLERIALPQGGEIVYSVAGGNRELLGVILHGKGAASFQDTIVQQTLATGDRVTAGCHIAHGHHAANQDRIVLNVHGSRVAGLDGFGSGGEIYATMLADGLLFDDTALAVRETIANTRGMMLGNSGACAAVAPIVSDASGKRLETPEWLGDVHITVLDANGHLVWESNDEDMGSILVRNGSASADEALYALDRATILNSVTGYGAHTGVTRGKSVPLQPGYRILVESDGRTDNLQLDEIPASVLRGPARDLLTWISGTVLRRMADAKTIRAATPDRRRAGRYADGFLSKPKPDNLSGAVIDIA